MKALHCFIALLALCSYGLSAQDAHYSMFNNAPLYLNPSLTGSMPTQYRLGINYRSQWASIPDAYQNLGAFFDAKRRNLGIGLVVNKNAAGVASLENTNLLLSLSLKKQLAGGNNEIAIGAQGGITQHRFDPTQHTFDKDT